MRNVDRVYFLGLKISETPIIRLTKFLKTSAGLNDSISKSVSGTPYYVWLFG